MLFRMSSQRPFRRSRVLATLAALLVFASVATAQQAVPQPDLSQARIEELEKQVRMLNAILQNQNTRPISDQDTIKQIVDQRIKEKEAEKEAQLIGQRHFCDCI